MPAVPLRAGSLPSRRRSHRGTQRGSVPCSMTIATGGTCWPSRGTSRLCRAVRKSRPGSRRNKSVRRRTDFICRPAASRRARFAASASTASRQFSSSRPQRPRRRHHSPVPAPDGGDDMKAWLISTTLEELEGPRGEDRRTIGRPALPIRGISAATTGTTCAGRRGPSTIASPRSSSSAAPRPVSRSPRGSISSASIRSSSRSGRASATAGGKRYHSLALHNSVHLNHLPVHGVSADVSDIHSKGHARELVRVLCRRHGDQLLDGYGVRRRRLG